MDTFELNDHEYIELNKLLKITGMCSSGGIAKVMIADGRVKVNDKVELRRRCKITAGQTIEYEGKQLQIC